MAPSETSPRTVRLLTAILLVATFAAGTVTGAGLFRWSAVHHGPPPPPIAHLPFWELELSAQQERKVQDVIERYRPELDAILQETFPRVRAVNEKIENEIGPILTPEQRLRLEEIKRRHRRLPPGGPRGAPPPYDPSHPGPPFLPPPPPLPPGAFAPHEAPSLAPLPPAMPSHS